MILAWFLVCSAGATTLSSNTSVGSGWLSQQIASDGFLDQAKTLSGAATYSYGRLEESGTSGNFVDETNTFGGMLNWMPELMQFRLAGSAANTPQEKLTTRGLSFDGGYRGRAWKWKLGVGATTYQESYSGSTLTKKGKTRTTTGTESLQQKFARADVRWRVRSWLSLRSALTVYGYGRNVAQFEANLDSPASVRRGADGFGGVVGGLPASSLLFEGAIDLSDAWDVTLTHTVSRLAVGGGQRSFVTRLEFGVDLDDAWHLDFGAERDRSPSFTDTLALVGVDVSF